MAQTLGLTATLEPRGPAGAFILTDEQVAELGAGRKVFPVRVRVNGASLSLRLARMGGENMIGLAAAARRQAGVEIGASYEIEIVFDEAEPTVEVPEDLSAALGADPEVDKAFAALAFSHRKEYIRWISEAKRETTRADRIAKAVEMLRAGRTR